jgi:hypothetical protein
MLSWLRRRRETIERIDAEADALVHKLGAAAYSAARRREHEASSDAMAKHWHRVALAIAKKTSKRVGFDTATRIPDELGGGGVDR